MSSTVTTATVSTVTAAITIEGLGQVFTLVALVLLAVVLLSKEIISASSNQRARTLARCRCRGAARSCPGGRGSTAPPGRDAAAPVSPGPAAGDIVDDSRASLQRFARDARL